MIILAIETSCDDTCAALVRVTGRKRPQFEILSDVRSSQVKIHAPYGGVVPNLAARAHLENMNLVLTQALNKLKIKNEPFDTTQGHPERSRTGEKLKTTNKNLKSTKTYNLKPITYKGIDLITVTTHPGLIPCLLIGTNVAKTLAWAWNKPIIGVNHLEGHLYVSWLKPTNINPKSQIANHKQITKHKTQSTKIEFPAVALIVSGGHTQLVLMKDYGKFKIIGETRDDAAGEAFDKVAKLLGLGYPGGPAISQFAAKWKSEVKSKKYEINLPRPMINSKDYDFSFSGLKTAVLYLVKDIQNKEKRKKQKLNKKRKKNLYPISYTLYPELCNEFQQAVIDVLITKTIKAAKNHKAKTIILGGGVGANKELRKQLETAVETNLSNVKCQMSNVKYCTDNAVMIAIAGYHRYLEEKVKTWKNVRAHATL